MSNFCFYMVEYSSRSVTIASMRSRTSKTPLPSSSLLVTFGLEFVTQNYERAKRDIRAPTSQLATLRLADAHLLEAVPVTTFVESLETVPREDGVRDEGADLERPGLL